MMPYLEGDKLRGPRETSKWRPKGTEAKPGRMDSRAEVLSPDGYRTMEQVFFQGF